MSWCVYVTFLLLLYRYVNVFFRYLNFSSEYEKHPEVRFVSPRRARRVMIWRVGGTGEESFSSFPFVVPDGL